MYIYYEFKNNKEMKTKFNNEEDIKELKHITILVDDVEFKISVNKFNELVINKEQYGDGESSIIIMPSVSNEIRIK